VKINHLHSPVSTLVSTQPWFSTSGLSTRPN
jgi:hypothetical protein